MRWSLLASVIALAVPSQALLRFPCSQLVTERFDPLVTPGEVSPHVHQIVGGNAFNLSMHPDNDLPALSTCTTCRFVEDKSNYWTAVLYFRHPNGSFIRVPQIANHNTGPGFQAGGMTVYYFQPNPPTKNLNVTAFRKGFRMIVGDPMLRKDPKYSAPANAQTSYRCFTSNDPSVFEAPSYGVDDTPYLPNRICSHGIRSNIYFPQCWDGVNLDTPDHSSHVTHPIGGLFGTDCPNEFPVRLPLLFLEIIWDTRPFNDPALWPKDGSQPFVFSMGDPTGWGQHADYVFGWEGDSLQRAMAVCTNADGLPQNCPALTLQDTDAMNNCRVPVKVSEVVENQYLDALPGCNPIQHGPDPATLIPGCAAISTTTAAPLPTEPHIAVQPPWTVCHPDSDGPKLGTQTLVPDCDIFETKPATPAPTVPPAIITPMPV